MSYLAPAKLLAVGAMPTLNGGAEILSVADAVGGDGPVVAAMASALGLQVRLVSNPPAHGEAGEPVARFLARHAVAIRPSRASESAQPPLLVVLGDAVGDRIWLSHLPGVETAILAGLESTAVGASTIVYIDAYPVIERAAIRALELARRSRARVYLNLAQGDPSPAIRPATEGAMLMVVQASLGEGTLDEAAALAQRLRESLACEVAVVTAGRHGAAAVSATGTTTHDAFDVPVVHAHCAGAAFTAGYLVALQRGWSAQRALRYASALGALRVSTSPGTEVFSDEAIAALVDQAGSSRKLQGQRRVDDDSVRGRA